MVLEEETTSANESDIRHLEPPLKKARLPERTPVCADRGYNSAEKQGSPGAHETESAHHMQHIMEAIACNLYQAPGRLCPIPSTKGEMASLDGSL